MKKLFKEHSPYILLIGAIEVILSIVSIEAFVYSDSLSYSDSLVYNSLGLEKLLENLYSSTFWALILFTLAFITICTITAIVYKKLDYFFMGILGWIVLLILGINVGNPIKDILTVFLLFIPILGLNIIAYKTEKKKLKENTKGHKNK